MLSDYSIQLEDQTQPPAVTFQLNCPELAIKNRIISIESINNSVFFYISDAPKTYVMNVWRHLKATNLFPYMTVMPNANNAAFVTQIKIISTLCPYANIV